MYSRNFDDRESGGQDGGLRSQRDREISGRIPADYNGEMLKKRTPEPCEEKPSCAVQQEEVRCSTCERRMSEPAPCPPQRPSKRRGLLGGLFGGDMETDDLLLLGLAFLLLTNNRDRDCDDGERDDIFLLLAMLFIIGM